MDPVKRFSNRADNYAKYRPGYPARVMEFLRDDCGLTQSSIVADVGSGTGILTELFLRNGNRVFAVEPNAPMRVAAEGALGAYPNFVSVAATAEETTLETASVDLIAAAQAFHWFDRENAKQEFVRILKPGGWVVLIWNERRLASTPFLQDYEALLLRYGTDYENVRHEKVTSEIAQFFAPEGFALKTLENFQHFDFESLKGRVLSSSYAPDESHPNFAPMLSELERDFNAHQQNGIVSFEYETKVYYGRLMAAM